MGRFKEELPDGTPKGNTGGGSGYTPQPPIPTNPNYGVELQPPEIGGRPYIPPRTPKGEPQATPLQTRYASTGNVGTSQGNVQALRALGQAFKGNEQTPDKMILRDFSMGLVTVYDRGQQPIGSFADVKNYMLNSKVGGLDLRWGTTSLVAPPLPNAQSTKELTAFYDFKRLATETPTSEYIDVVLGRDSGANRIVFQKTYWDSGGSKATNYLWWGESFTPASIISLPGGASIVLAAGVNSVNYYRYWTVWNSTRSEGMYVSSSSFSTNSTLVLFEDIPSDWTTGDTVVVYRHFQQNPGFTPTFLDLSASAPCRPSFLQQGDAILFCGGRGSNVGLKPIWSGYISQTWMTGTTPFTYTGTYVEEAAPKQANTSSGILLENPTSYATTTALELGAARWFFGVVCETFDGQRGMFTKPGTDYVDLVAAQGLQADLNIYAGNLNKRFRYLNLFAGKTTDASATSLPWTEMYWVAQLDLTDGTGWNHVATVTTTLGYHEYRFQMNLTGWNTPATGNKETLAVHLGSSEYSAQEVSFNYSVFLNNRLIVADYYDYNDTLTYNDGFRVTVTASNGVPQLNSLRNLDDETQFYVEQGDPNTVTGLSRIEDKLFILKSDSCYYVPISGTPPWSLVTISKNVGGDCPHTLVATPYGVVWARTLDDVYLWNGNQVESMAKHWRPTFRAITTGTNTKWEAWYDTYAKTYNLAPSTSTFSDWYNMFFELPWDGCFSWSKQGSVDTFANIRIGADRVIYFTVGSDSPIAYFDTTVTADQSVGIRPYLDTGEYTLTEQEFARFREWWLTNTQTTPDSAALDIQITIDAGTALTGLTSMTKASTRLSSRMPLTANGKSIRFKFNTNGTPVTWATYSIHEIGFGYTSRNRRGDMRKSV